MHSLARRLHVSIFSALAILGVSIAAAFWVTLSLDPFTFGGTPITIVAEAEEAVSPPLLLHQYIEVMEGCGPHYEGECVLTYAGPGKDYRAVSRLRRGIVLQVEPVLGELRLWYKVIFDEPLRYPERLPGDQFLSVEDVRHFYSDSVRATAESSYSSTTKEIIVDRSEQKLYAYDEDGLFMETSISTGLQMTPTPRGLFTVYKKTPTRYMQGPLPGIADQYYDLPGVPWNLYFTQEGGVIHGAYWHNGFGQRWSHGCVNVPLDEARTLYEWAEVGTPVLVRD